MKEQPKILVFTVGSWNSRVGSNTWSTLLEGYPSDNIANICIRDEYPDSSVCSRYFKISESRIIKSILHRNIKTGEEIGKVEDNKENIDLEEHNIRYQIAKKNRRYSLLLAREVVWKLGKWKTKELNVFLDEFKPDIILHSMEGYIHLNRIIEYAIKRTDAKAIGYFWDDNFTYKQSKNIGHNFYRFFQRKSLKRLVQASSGYFAISPMTKQEADQFFEINSVVLTKPLSCVPEVTDLEMKKPISMIYTGKLIIGRDHTLERLIAIIKESFVGSFNIEVYTNTPLSEELQQLSDGFICTIHHSVPQNEVLELQKKSDVMLFLEDIDGKDALTSRLSFSTKTTDYLSTGKCIFALGNTQTAPIQYFKQNNAALVASTDEEIKCCLKKLLNSKAEILKIVKNAVSCARQNHDPKIVKSNFWKEIYRVYNVD